MTLYLYGLNSISPVFLCNIFKCYCFFESGIYWYTCTVYLNWELDLSYLSGLSGSEKVSFSLKLRNGIESRLII